MGSPPVTTAIGRPPHPLVSTIIVSTRAVAASRPRVFNCTSVAASSRPVGTTSTVSWKRTGRSSWAACASRPSRICWARAAVTYATFCVERSEPATSMATSASPSGRASSGTRISTDCTREDWTRLCWRCRTPDSIRKSPSMSNPNVVRRHVTTYQTVASPMSSAMIEAPRAMPTAVQEKPEPGRITTPAANAGASRSARSTGVSPCACSVGLLSIAGYSPAWRCSPRCASRSRSAAATAGSSPGIDAFEVAEAVCSCTVAMPSARSSGPEVTSTSCIRP